MAIDHLNLKLLIFITILQVLRFDFKKFRILEVLSFHPCTLYMQEAKAVAKLCRLTNRLIQCVEYQNFFSWPDIF